MTTILIYNSQLYANFMKGGDFITVIDLFPYEFISKIVI